MVMVPSLLHLVDRDLILIPSVVMDIEMAESALDRLQVLGVD
jgi:hypothetical protein